MNIKGRRVAATFDNALRDAANFGAEGQNVAMGADVGALPQSEAVAQGKASHKQRKVEQALVAELDGRGVRGRRSGLCAGSHPRSSNQD